MTFIMLTIFSRRVALDRQARKLLREALLLGLEVNYLLWGVQIVMSYYYYKSYRKTDSAWMKGAVALLFITDALQSIFVSMFCWAVIVRPKHPGWWPSYAIPFLDASTASIVHAIYAQKIFTLLRSPYNYICTALVLTLSFVQLGAGLGSLLFMDSISMTFSELERLKNWASIWLVTAAVTDIFITTTITWWLSKSRTGIKRTDDIISKLIRLIIETGLATAIIQTVQFVLYLVWPLKPYQIFFAFLIPKVYGNSMLALLNSRKPSKTGETCFSCQDKAVDRSTIQITQTVDISRDHELGERYPPSSETVTSKTVRKSTVESCSGRDGSACVALKMNEKLFLRELSG